MAIASRNPATGELQKEFAALTADELKGRLAKSRSAFLRHRTTEFSDRALCMNEAASILERDADRYARIMTNEMGKLLRASVEELEKCARCCRFYAENAAAFLAEHEVQTDAKRSYVRYDPIGTVLAIMPWNFPFWQVFRFAAPALMAGNAGLLKHASNVPACALAIEEIFQRAGFSEGVFQSLLIENETTEQIIADPRIAAVTLTGSDRAGAAVASAAGRALKKTVLELGGSDPFIVMPSANLEAAVAAAVKSRTINTGQSCIAAKRFILHEKIYDSFVAKFVDQMRALRLGDPLDESTDVGPLSSEQILRGVEDQVKKSIALGAKCLTGGRRIDRAGYYYEPTVLTEVPQDSPAYREEIFGPVAAVFCVSSVTDAIALANDHQYGLGASIWTNDASERESFARGVDSGMIFVNAMVASDPRLPFGGVKRSGYGRELSAEGIREFVNIKTVYVAS